MIFHIYMFLNIFLSLIQQFVNPNLTFHKLDSIISES